MNVRFGAAKVIIGNIDNPVTKKEDTITKGFNELIEKAITHNGASHILLKSMQDGVTLLFTREKEDELTIKTINPNDGNLFRSFTNKLCCEQSLADLIQEIRRHIDRAASMYPDSKIWPMVSIEKDNAVKDSEMFENELLLKDKPWNKK